MIPAIRQATASDIEVVFRLNQHCFQEAWSLESLRSAVDRGNDLLVWYGSYGHLMAYYLGQDVLDEAHILQIGVAPLFRRQGVGSRMTRWLLEEKARQGIREAFLEVRASNRIAQQMYLKLGFRITGRRRDYYAASGNNGPEDALTMSCAIHQQLASTR